MSNEQNMHDEFVMLFENLLDAFVEGAYVQEAKLLGFLDGYIHSLNCLLPEETVDKIVWDACEQIMHEDTKAMQKMHRERMEYAYW